MNLSRRTSRLTAAAALALALAPSVASAAKAPVQPQCPDRPGRTLAVDHKLRVYQTVVQDKKDPDASTLRVFSCSGLERKAKLLLRQKSNLDAEVRVERAVIGGGRWIALSFTTLTGVSDSRSLGEYDATIGQRVATISAPEDAGPDSGNDSYFDQLQVSKGGALAYVGAGRLIVADQDGLRVVVPASGTAVPAIGDLAVAGSHVYWTTTATQLPGTTLVTGHAAGELDG